MAECGGVFSSNLCCLELLIWLVIAEEAEEVVDAGDKILAEPEVTAEAEA